MKKLVQCIFLLSLSCLQAKHQNLIILVDTAQQETSKKDDITATHQLITALQQQAAPILVSASLWKNIVDRKQKFSKKLDDRSSLELVFYDLYKDVNKELELSEYNLNLINQKLSLLWYKQNYHQLACLSQVQVDQLKFNFLCYNFDFNMDQWSCFDAQTGMILFVPQSVDLSIHNFYKILVESDLTLHHAKKNNIIQTLQLFFDGNYDDWILYLSGHGNVKAGKEVAHIAGMPIHEFSDFLSYINNKMKIKLLVYSSCYAGGINSVQPYKNMKLHYPVIVIALTDAPIYGFGFFEGIKLAPYSQDYYLTAQDVQKGQGLLPLKIQQFDTFFTRAWSGLHDIKLIESVSQFFTCDKKSCFVKKIENMPLIRDIASLSFDVMHDTIAQELVHKVTNSQVGTTQKSVLLYVKKVDTIQFDNPVAIVSMLPGLQNHQINKLIAHNIPLSRIIQDSFLSLADATKNKNYLIDTIICNNDIIEPFGSCQVTHCMLIQEGFMPKFLPYKSETFISFRLNEQAYLMVWRNEKPEKIMKLTSDQTRIMIELENFLQQGIDFQDDVPSSQLVVFDAYVKNKVYQKDIIESCLQQRICKK